MGDVYWGVHAPFATLAAQAGIKRAFETGTYFGTGSLVLGALFENVVSIERETKFHSLCQKLYGHTNVEFLHGSSPEILGRVLSENGERSFFFLDAHWFPTSHLKKSSKENQCPVVDEIIEISKYTNAKEGSVIVIDDADMFLGSLPHTFSTDDFPSISTLISRLYDDFCAYSVDIIDDVIVAYGFEFEASFKEYESLKKEFGGPASKRVNF